MIFAGIWRQVHPSSVSSNILPTYLRSTYLGTAFQGNNVLVKSFTVLVTHFAEIFWEKIQMWLQNVDFQNHITSHSFLRSQKVLHNILIVGCFVISQEVLANPLKWQPCISLSLIQVFTELFVLHQFPDLGPYKYTLLDFCVTHIWELIPHTFESTAGFIHTFHKVFHEAQLYMQRWQINFLRKNNRRIDDIFIPWPQWCSFWPQFIYIIILLVPAVSLSQETAVFCVTKLHSEQQCHNLEITT